MPVYRELNPFGGSGMIEAGANAVLRETLGYGTQAW